MKIPNQEVHLLKSISNGYGVADEMGHVTHITKSMAPYDKNPVSGPHILVMTSTHIFDLLFV